MVTGKSQNMDITKPSDKECRVAENGENSKVMLAGKSQNSEEIRNTTLLNA